MPVGQFHSKHRIRERIFDHPFDFNFFFFRHIDPEVSQFLSVLKTHLLFYNL